MCKSNQILITGVFLCLLLPLTLLPSQAQQKKPQKVQAFYDTTAVPEVFQKIPIGFRFIFADQSTASTRGFLNGKIRWKDLDIKTAQGVVHNGALRFDPKKVWENRHRVSFQVTYAGTTLPCHMTLPYLEKIQLNLFTDSIKPDVPFYLNTEGHFSSGNVYPLDTEKLRFYVSAGTLTGNVLRLPEEDSSTKKILIKSTFKWDEDITDSAVVPVKIHIKAFHLPTEGELLQQWKKKRRRD